jgi:methyltransferase (TIGR00027 family)
VHAVRARGTGETTTTTGTGNNNTFAHRLAGRPSVTAEAVAVARVVERLRPESERIVDDPYAHLFLGRAGKAAVATWRINGPATRLVKRLDPGGVTYIACRHRYLDDQMQRAVAEGAEQIVLLGAGYDTRAYRFSDQIGGRSVFEVDLAAISRRKARTIAAHRGEFPDVDVRRVEIDFETQTLGDRLTEAGFERATRTFVIWEGVAMYLTRSAVKTTILALADLCGAGSGLGMDCWYLVDDPSPIGTARRLAPAALSLIGEAVTFGVHPDEMPFFLGQLGFDVCDIATSTELEERYGRGRRRAEPSMYLLTASRGERRPARNPTRPWEEPS